MSNGIERRPLPREIAFFSYGFRPFFLGGALFAGVAIPAWISILVSTGNAALLSTARDWHVHEMLFGFLPAVIAGFLLTAVPNWTDRPAVKGRELMLLFGVWGIGRVAMALPTGLPLLTALLDGAFLVCLAGVVWRELAAGKSWNQAPVGVVISCYACANLWFHLSAWSDADTDRPFRMALALMMVLLTLIGGRLVPNFTREFLGGEGRAERPARFSHFDTVAIGLVTMAAVFWTVSPHAQPTGWILLAAGVMQVARLLRWYGWLTWREPLVFVLHWGYGWVAAALLLLGCAIVGIGLSKEDAVHALTTGAIGVMTLGVMTRASLGHTGRPRHAGPATICMYSLVTVGALVRVFGLSTGLPPTLVLGVAAAAWSGAYFLFALVYGPYLLRPSLDE